MEVRIRSGSIPMAKLPEEAGKVVGIAHYRGMIVLCCEYGVWIYDDNDTLTKLEYSGEDNDPA